jgi:hypothetical protein
LLQTTQSIIPDFPGVFDYEVSSPFGKWFGEYILKHPTKTPPERRARNRLKLAVREFFLQVEDNAEKRRRLSAQIEQALLAFELSYDEQSVVSSAQI